MKRKGFTLIELLAVIVVLAIIALIATPIVMNVIKDAQMGAAERSADNYVKAVETLIATEKLDGNSIADGNYTIDSNGNLTFGSVEVSGTKPNGGTIVVENGQVVKEESSIVVGDYTVTYKDGKANATEETGPLTLASCTLEDGTANTVGAKYSCDLGDGERMFYVLEAGTESKPATLILEGNFDATTQAWCDQVGVNEYDEFICQISGNNINKKLDEIAGVWSKLDRSQIGLPSMEQIMVADGREEDAYLEWPKLSNEWLCGGNVYWASTTRGEWWYVFSGGDVDSSASLYDAEGVRPVIMLSI